MRSMFECIKEKYGDTEIVGVEVGVWRGDNAQEVLSGLPNIKRLYLVDNEELEKGSLWVTIDKLNGHNGSVKVINKSSVEAAKEVPDKSLDFVYIDADHSKESVKEDIKAWFPKVKPDGVLGGHDYNKIEFGVFSAVNEFVKKRNFNLNADCPEDKLGYDGIRSDWWIKLSENGHGVH